MFITDYPAMFIEGHVVIADVHLGISGEMMRAGVRVPNQAKRLAEKANRLGQITKAKKLVVLGDIKHGIPTSGFGESREIAEFLSLLDFDKIIIVKGNHDGDIEKLLGGIEAVSVRKSLALGNYLLTHGHRNVSTTKKNIVIGHNHPSVKLVDKMHASYTMPCWVIGRVRLKNNHRLIIMPSFNELAGFMAVNDGKYERFNGPVARRMNKGGAKAYLLDGTSLGTVRGLMLKD